MSSPGKPSAPDATELLQELIAIPSINPAFLPPNDKRAGEKNIAAFLEDKARRHGLPVTRQPVQPNRSNLIVRLPARGKKSGVLLLAPHLDTVGGSDPDLERLLKPRLAKGRIHGRGACDTKGSIAVMFTAFLRQAALGGLPHTEIMFAGLVDEECRQLGSRALARSRRRIDLAVVGEPTRNRVVTAHKGAFWLRLVVEGKAAHGARPELGRNAVVTMTRVVERLALQYAPRLRRKSHPLLGPATINVGMIKGGNQPNIVPDRCEILIDRRTLPGETAGRLIRELKRAAGDRRIRFEPLQPEPCLPLETDPALPWVRNFLACNRQTKPEGVDYFSDGSVLSAAGIATVLFGPGDIAQAHTLDEWVPCVQVARGVEILLKFFSTLP